MKETSDSDRKALDGSATAGIAAGTVIFVLLLIATCLTISKVFRDRERARQDDDLPTLDVGPRANPPIDMYAQPVQPVTAPSQLADIVVQLDEPGPAPRLSSASFASVPVDSSRDSAADADDDDEATAAPSTPEPKVLSAKAQGKLPIAHEAEPRASSAEEPRPAQYKELQAETITGVAGVVSWLGLGLGLGLGVGFGFGFGFGLGLVLGIGLGIGLE